MKSDTKKEWIVTAVLLLISSLFGLAGFLVGRSAYGKTVSKLGDKQWDQKKYLI